jgi:hypothetical protein
MVVAAAAAVAVAVATVAVTVAVAAVAVAARVRACGRTRVARLHSCAKVDCARSNGVLRYR